MRTAEQVKRAAFEEFSKTKAAAIIDAAINVAEAKGLMWCYVKVVDIPDNLRDTFWAYMELLGYNIQLTNRREFSGDFYQILW